MAFQYQKDYNLFTGNAGQGSSSDGTVAGTSEEFIGDNIPVKLVIANPGSAVVQLEMREAVEHVKSPSGNPWVPVGEPTGCAECGSWLRLLDGFIYRYNLLIPDAQATGAYEIRFTDNSYENYEYHVHDHSEFNWSCDAEGNPIAADNSIQTQNHVYVPFDPEVHLPGVVVGDGTTANPFQIPVCPKPNFKYVPFDPSVHTSGVITGLGTLADPFEIPLEMIPPTNFTYVPYNAEIHDEGVIEGSGTAADPWQIPLEPIQTQNHVYVPFDPEVHLPGVVVGDGTTANPFQIPLFDSAKRTCSLEVVKTEDILTAPPAVGDILSFSVCLINSGTEDLANIVVDDFLADGVTVNPDSVVNGSPVASLAAGAKATVTVEHTVTQADVDAGGVQNIAVATGEDPQGNAVISADDATCKFGIVPPCENPGICVSRPEEVIVPCGTEETPFEFTQSLLDSGQDGWGIWAGYDGSDGNAPSTLTQILPGPWTIPVPAPSQPGCLLLLQIGSGLSQPVGTNNGVSQLGLVEVSDPTSSADVGPKKEVCVNEGTATAYNSQLFVFEAHTGNSGGTVDLTLPNNPSGNDLGVIQYHWVELCAIDGLPIPCSKLLSDQTMIEFFANVDNHGGNPGPDFVQGNEFMTNECPWLWFAYGRHVEQAGGCDNGGQPGSIGCPGIHDTNWVEVPGSFESHDVASANGRSGRNQLCQIGTAGGFIPPNTTFTPQVSSNTPNGQGDNGQEWDDHMLIKFIPVDCFRRPCDDVEPVETEAEYGNICGEPAAFKKTADFVIDFAIADSDVIDLIPVINGVQDTANAIIGVSASGTQTLSICVDLETLAEGETGNCTFSWIAQAASGTGLDSTVTVQATDICIGEV